MSDITVMLLFWQYSVVWCNGTILCEHKSKKSLLLNYYKKCQQNTLLKMYLLIQDPTFSACRHNQGSYEYILKYL